jgi:hypothetical protein
MDYLHALYMILMVSICVLYMTLMVFIYVYYRLFACTNLVDIMLLFFYSFFFSMTNFLQNLTNFCQNWSRNHVADFQKKSAISR